MSKDKTVNRVREFREKLGITQEELASRAQISFFTVSRIENGHTVPQRSTKAAIAQALGIKVDTLWPGSPRRKAAAVR